jgi:biopolymer transport protein ExbD
MSGGGNAGGDDGEEGFDLNLAPIIDCFTVLITYLLVSASFVSLSMLEVAPPQLPSSVPLRTPNEPKKPVSLTLLLTEQEAIEIVLTGDVSRQWRMGLTEMGRIEESLQLARQIAPSLQDVTVKAQKLVSYGKIATVIERVKPIFPTVFLGD